jgi:two-component system, OmpR family, phosphate regulon response regulator PhoB
VLALKSILLVEDSRFLRMAIEQVLVRAGYKVLTAGDGEEALRIAYSRIPHLIVLDMLLPKLGGPEVLQALKGSALTAHIPVIVLSSLSQKNEAKLKQAGAVAYFEKSKLELDQHSASLLQIVKRTLDSIADRSGAEGSVCAPINLPGEQHGNDHDGERSELRIMPPAITQPGNRTH